tara:strand:- start:677 stop:1534 length:858 start_codon:yes stop_codon:yes gene_type:complete
MSAKSSTPVPTTPEVTHAKTPSAPKKAAKKEKVVKEKVVKEKVVKEKKEKAVKKAKKEEVKEEVEEEVKEKKARPATLPAKYNKFIQYSYYLIRALNNASLEKHGEELLDEELFFNEAHVFGDVKTQEEFVTSFLENKSIGKEMKTHVADKKKAAVKAEKEAAKAAVKAEKEAVKAAAKAEKEAAKAAAKAEKQAGKTTKPKKEKKEKKEEKDLVTSLVTLANSDEAVPDTETENMEEEEELDVQMFEHKGKEYLIDDNNTLYDVDNHTVVGTWDKENEQIISAK